MLRVVLSVVLAASAAFAQNVISAKSGLVNYFDGDVQVAGEPIQNKPSSFTSIKVGQELRTTEGRAEVLLTPGVFLRLGENSAFRMISNSLTDPKVALIQGSALIQVIEVAKDTPITVLYGDRAVLLAKAGVYRFDVSSTEASLRVYEGEAKIGDRDIRRGRELALTGDGEIKEIAKFDTKDTDQLYRWASRRDQYISMANVSSAVSSNSYLSNNNCGASFGNGSFANTSWNLGYMGAAANSGYFGRLGGWRFNPCYGMYTYLPYNGIYTSPFGWSYYGPRQALYLVFPPVNRGGSGVGLASTGFIGHGGSQAAFGGSQPISAPTGASVGYAPGGATPAGAAPSSRATPGGGAGAALGSSRGPR